MTLVEIAAKYIGQREIPGNQGFVNKEFDAKMRGVGFVNGSPWCMFFVRLCVKETFPEQWHELDGLLSPHCLTALRRLRAAGYEISLTPTAGAIFIMQKGSTMQGHTGITIAGEKSGKFMTTEGNTNDAGSREGEVVANKTRSLITTPQPQGLWVRGFIKI